MTGHGKARRLLYDYLRGSAGTDETRFVSDHLARCAQCAAEAESLRSLLKLAPDGSKRPSASLSDAYWARFADDVMGRIGTGPVPRPGIVDRILRAAGLRGLAGAPGGIPAAARRLSPAFAVVAAVTVVLYFALARTGAEHDGPVTGTVPGIAAEVPADSSTQFDRRLTDYFKRSKALLVGVSNIDPGEDHPIDLDAERRISRSLLRESRILRSGPVDPRSYRLMEDIDQIMIGLANSDAAPARPAVDVIRGGIENKNLLFKLRMQETGQYRIPVLQASYKQ